MGPNVVTFPVRATVTDPQPLRCEPDSADGRVQMLAPKIGRHAVVIPQHVPVSPRLNVFHALTPGKRFNRKICLAAPAAGQERSRIVADGGDAWSVDPLTLRGIVLDPHRMRARLVSCIDLERVWILTLLGEYEEAVETAG